MPNALMKGWFFFAVFGGGGDGGRGEGMGRNGTEWDETGWRWGDKGVKLSGIFRTYLVDCFFFRHPK